MDEPVNHNSVVQSHFGIGSNALSVEGEGNEFHINQYSTQLINLAPENIRQPLTKAVDLIRKHELESAKLIIETLKSTGALDPQSEIALHAIHALAQDKDESGDAFDVLLSKLQQCDNPTTVDFVEAALFILEIRAQSNSHAIQRYKASSTKGPVLREMYLRHSASSEEVHDYYEANKYVLNASQIENVIHRTLALEEYEFAQELAKNLTSRQNTQAHQELLFFVQACSLNPLFIDTHYWKISLSDYERVSRVAEQLKLYLREKSISGMTANVAIALANYFKGHDTELLELCIPHIDSIRERNEFVANWIQYRLTKDVSAIETGDMKTFIESFGSEKGKTAIREEILQTKKLSDLHLSHLSGLFSANEIDDLLNAGVSFKDDSNEAPVNEFRRLYLLTYSLSKRDREKSEALRLAVTSFCEKNSTLMQTFNPEFLLDMAERLADKHCFHAAISILEPCVELDTWLSPLKRQLIHLLALAQSDVRVNEYIKALPEEYWSPHVYQARANIAAKQGLWPDTIDYLYKASIKWPDITRIYLQLIYAYEKAHMTQEEIYDRLAVIPVSSYQTPSQDNWHLCFKLTQYGHFSKVEPIIIEWFIESPNKHATNLTNFTFAIRNYSTTFSDQSGNALKGYVIDTGDGRKTTKLVVEKHAENHPNIVSSTSPLGTNLLNSSVGSSFELNGKTITIDEILSPFIACAWRIATELRDIQNDGNDAFQIMTTKNPEDINGIIDKLRANSQARSEYGEQIFSAINVPLQIKGFWLNRADPVEAAITVLVTKSCLKPPVSGISSRPINNKIVLDVYGCIFLIVTQLLKSPALSNYEFYITIETHEIISAWLETEKAHGGYAGFDEDGRFTMTDFDHPSIKALYQGMKSILVLTSTAYPDLFNVPYELSRFDDYLDLSTSSSVKVCFGGKYDYFCIDRAFAQLMNDAGIDFGDTNQLCSQLLNDLSPDDKAASLSQCLYSGISFSVSFKALVEIAACHTTSHADVLIRMLDNWHANYSSEKLCIGFMSDLAKHSIILMLNSDSYFDDVQHRLSVGYKLFFSCLHHVATHRSELKVEERLAVMATLLLKSTNGMDSFQVIIRLFYAFLEGHFMDKVHFEREVLLNLNSFKP
jgi:hypothetical protein